MTKPDKPPVVRPRRAIYADAQAIDCPKCSAQPGFPCVRVRGGSRASFHAARIAELRRLTR